MARQYRVQGHGLGLEGVLRAIAVACRRPVRHRLLDRYERPSGIRRVGVGVARCGAGAVSGLRSGRRAALGWTAEGGCPYACCFDKKLISLYSAGHEWNLFLQQVRYAERRGRSVLQSLRNADGARTRRCPRCGFRSGLFSPSCLSRGCADGGGSVWRVLDSGSCNDY